MGVQRCTLQVLAGAADELAPVAVRVGDDRGEGPGVAGSVDVDVTADLLQFAEGGSVACLFAGLGEAWHDDGGKDSENHDDDEDLNEREPRPD